MQSNFLLYDTFFSSRSKTCTSLTTIFLGRLAWAGLFKNGKSYGASWRGCDGGGFLYGSVGPNGLFTGNKNAYIYPGKKKQKCKIGSGIILWVVWQIVLPLLTIPSKKPNWKAVL